MIVKTQEQLTFLNPLRASFEPDILEGAIFWYLIKTKATKPIARNKKIFMLGEYPAISIHGEKLHIHRLLMKYVLHWFDMDRRIYINHKDENKLNALLENLELMGASEHQSMTNKGRKHTREHNYKIGLANKKRKGTKYRIYENPELLVNSLSSVKKGKKV